MNFNFFDHLDLYRRWLGMVMDFLNFGPVETPSRVVIEEQMVTLRTYGPGNGGGPVVLLIPAPIKRAYIWDLLPAASVVQRLLHGGIRVYLLQWQPPGGTGQGLGLNEYADRLILKCLDSIRSETGHERTFLAGHSIGGTLAAIFSSLHPDRVQGLVLAGAPLNFGKDVGIFGPLTASLPRSPSEDKFLVNVPGSLLSMISFMSSPVTFGWARWLDALNSLGDVPAMRIHSGVERWTLDELPLPGQLVKEIIDLLYRENRFMRGNLTINGMFASADSVTAPILCIVNEQCDVVPPESVLPFYNIARSQEKRLLWYKSDTGVALPHVGMLVGKSAHRRLWPRVIRWMHRRN